MLVISEYGFNTPGSIALNRRLNGVASEMGNGATGSRPGSPAAPPSSTTTAG